MPAPNKPRAKPLNCSRGCHAEVQAMPAVKSCLANPTRKARDQQHRVGVNPETDRQGL